MLLAFRDLYDISDVEEPVTNMLLETLVHGNFVGSFQVNENE